MKKIFLLLFAVLFIPCAFSVPLEELISPQYASRLRSGGDLILETQLKNPSPKMLPFNNELRQYITGTMNSINPSMLVEALYLYKKPVSSDNKWTERQRSGLYNQMLALSTMTGIQYYSASRDAMRTFFESSQVIDGPNSKKPLADPVHTVPPASLSLFARQKDLTFGDNIYRYDYTSGQNMIIFTQENISSLSIGIVPVVGKGNLRSVVVIFDCEDALLIYSASMVKALSVPGMGERVGNSFGTRAEAIIKWFSGRADIVF